MAPWIHDVVVENTPLSTTGGHTWNAAYRLAEYFSTTAAQIGLDTPQNKRKINVLELGAGCGYLGMTVARNIPNANIICLTEQEDGCQWLRYNVQLNKDRGLPLGAVVVQPLDWLHYCPSFNSTNSTSKGDIPRKVGIDGGEVDKVEKLTLEVEGKDDQPSPPLPPPPPPGLALDSITWDFIIGSDLIYNKIGSTCLPRVFAALSSPNTQIYYCHTKHRFDLLDIEFFENLTTVGLTFEEVWEPEREAPPESPPLQFPPLDLFPEQRIAILKISKLS